VPCLIGYLGGGYTRFGGVISPGVRRARSGRDDNSANGEKM
jgi:hypothetical protein